MRITDYPPIDKVSHSIYREEMQQSLSFDHLIPGKNQRARFLRGKGEQHGEDFIVMVGNIGKVAVNQPRRFWLPLPFEVISTVELYPTDVEGRPITNRTDRRAVNGRGWIYNRRQRAIEGYFVSDLDEPQHMDDLDMEFMQLLNDPGSLPKYKPSIPAKA
jgi:hypothetical protein